MSCSCLGTLFCSIRGEFEICLLPNKVHNHIRLTSQFSTLKQLLIRNYHSFHVVGGVGSRVRHMLTSCFQGFEPDLTVIICHQDAKAEEQFVLVNKCNKSECCNSL